MLVRNYLKIAYDSGPESNLLILIEKREPKLLLCFLYQIIFILNTIYSLRFRLQNYIFLEW
jgi:hypothetical protein